MSKNASTAPHRTHSAPRERPRSALLALLSLVLASGSLLPAAAAHADTATATGADWEEVVELAGYNGALTAFDDPKSGPTIIFPSDYTGDIHNLKHPSDWTDSTGATPTSWPTPTTAKSPMFTQDQLNNVQNAVLDAIQPGDDTTTYSLAAAYDGASDRVVVQTNAPSSVTDPLAAKYPNQVAIQGPPASTPPTMCTEQTSLTSDPGNTRGATAASDQLQAMADYNCALSAYQDPNTGPVITFPSDYAGDINNLQIPQHWTDSNGDTPTSWPTPTTTRSVKFTAAQVQKIITATVAQIEPVGSTIYYAAAHYDGMSDRIVVSTDAPSSVTDPLVAAYPDQVTIHSQTAPAMQIVNKQSNLDLGIDGASTAYNAGVVQQTADATANQQWRLIFAGNGQYKLKNVNSGLLLGIAGGVSNPGAPAVQWDDNGHDDHLWKVVDADRGYVKLVNVRSGLPLDVDKASTDPGASALQNTDNGTDSELWQLTPIN
ncbi:RICIN domain-containing protein [Streptomyces sp. NBC_00285]|uniref:RICIN domain-containing protein n=1 Tax=Streptomyces sp. NBC_00285 TaxID=2975700 RepID=UPI002E290482|nr:RICIN domain-containing protein [Streptomyces sp. NBC_00285]